MAAARLGTTEEYILLIVFRHVDKAYGVTIHQDLEEAFRREVAIGSIYTSLERLENKGYITSWWGEATAERGGRRKKYYKIEGAGQQALNDARLRRESVAGLVGLRPQACRGSI